MTREALAQFDRDIQRIVTAEISGAAHFHAIDSKVTAALFDGLNPARTGSGPYFSVSHNSWRGELRVYADLTSERDDDRVMHIYQVSPGRALLSSIQNLSAAVGRIAD